MRTLGIDYGDSRVGIAVTDSLGITAQGLETIAHNGNDKILLKRLDEILEKFIHKLKCKYNKIKIETIDERLTTVAAHKTMNFLDVNKTKKRGIVDTISAVYILEMYMNKSK